MNVAMAGMKLPDQNARVAMLSFVGSDVAEGKNEVACLRGTHFNQLSNVCFEGSNAAFCQEGFHTYCDENGILICK